MIHEGQYLKSCLYKSGIQISEVAEKVGKSKQAVYTDFMRERLSNKSKEIYKKALNIIIDNSIIDKENVDISREKSFPQDINNPPDLDMLKQQVAFLERQTQYLQKKLDDAMEIISVLSKQWGSPVAGVA